MDLNETMATTVAPLMPTKEQVSKELWLPASELEVYASEYERTGFQGGLNWYRCNTDGTNRAELGACPSNQLRGHILGVLFLQTTTACGHNCGFCITRTRSYRVGKSLEGEDL
jgi:hypothetical protein